MKIKSTMNTRHGVRSETWALKTSLMKLQSAAPRKIERTMLGITIRDHKRNTWIRPKTGFNDIIGVIKKRNASMGGTHCTTQRQD